MNRKILFIHAKWCMPCKYFTSHLIHPVEIELPDQVVQLDVDVSPSMAERLGADRVPCIIFYEDGKPVGKAHSLLNPDDVIRWLKGGKYHDSHSG